MKPGMSLEALLTEVQRQNSVKRDYVTSTKDNIRMVESEGMPDNVAVVLLRQGADELERFSVSETAHRQIAAKLSIPQKYYYRLLTNHRDMVVDQVNKLFEREPSMRLIRTLDSTVRAFLSDRYKRLDNAQVLEQTLPAIVKGDIETTLLSSNVGENHMRMKVLFTGDELAQEVARTPTDEPRIVRPGFRMSNSETGHGTLEIEGFFFDSYCTNGCVFGRQEAFNFRRTHLGGRLIEGVDYEVLSDRSRKLEDDTIISQVSDVMRAMATPEFANQLGNKLRRASSTEPVERPVAAVDLAVKNLDLQESERESILEAFIGDRDYTQWGLASAVTRQANDGQISYERACELEDIGGQILSMELNQWNRYVHAEVQQAA